jgi:hypothetical protein
MGAYSTVVVGTDGSGFALRAVDRAGQIAADRSQGRRRDRVLPAERGTPRADILKVEGFKTTGNAPIFATCGRPRSRQGRRCHRGHREGHRRRRPVDASSISPMRSRPTCWASATSA